MQQQSSPLSWYSKFVFFTLTTDIGKNFILSRWGLPWNKSYNECFWVFFCVAFSIPRPPLIFMPMSAAAAAAVAVNLSNERRPSLGEMPKLPWVWVCDQRTPSKPRILAQILFAQLRVFFQLCIFTSWNLLWTFADSAPKYIYIYTSENMYIHIKIYAHLHIYHISIYFPQSLVLWPVKTQQPRKTPGAKIFPVW